MVLALATCLLIGRVNIPIVVQQGPTNIAGVWRALPATFRRLLASDVFIRTSEGLTDVFLVLYATNIIGISAPQFGILIGVQMATAILVYLPAARLADGTGRKPFVIATFVAFSLFPLAVIVASSFETLVGAFVVGGLREIGEPARKALIVDLAEPHLRARSVGMYYLVRSLAITPAALIGSVLWQVRPAMPFVVASAVGLMGTMLFALTVDEEHAA